MKSPRITIIGFGNVGKALFHQFIEQGLELISVFNRSEIASEFLQNYKEISFHQGMPESDSNIGDQIFITVSDDALASVIEKLADTSIDFINKCVCHCSGTHSSTALHPVKEKGAKIASFHPIKAVTSNTKSFKNTWFDVEGDEDAIQNLKEIADRLQAQIVKINPESKPYLHAAAVVASNYLVVLSDIVSRISEAGNIPRSEALQSMIPLMMNTLENIQEMGTSNALTGPIKRGDVNTVKEHLNILEKNPDLISLYKTLGLETVQLAEQKHGKTSALKEIKKLLS